MSKKHPFQNSEQSEHHPSKYPSASMLWLFSWAPGMLPGCQGSSQSLCADVSTTSTNMPFPPLQHLHCRADDCHCPQCLAGPQNCSLWLNLVILPLLLHMDSLTTVVLNLNIAVFLLTALTLAFLGFFVFSWYRSCSLLLQPFTVKHPLPYSYHCLQVLRHLERNSQTPDIRLKKKIPSQPWHYLKEKKKTYHVLTFVFSSHMHVWVHLCVQLLRSPKGKLKYF